MHMHQASHICVQNRLILGFPFCLGFVLYSFMFFCFFLLWPLMILCWFTKPQLPILDECLVLVEKECFLQRMNDLKLYLKGIRTKRMRNAVATLQTNLIPVCKYFLVLPRARKMDTKVFFFWDWDWNWDRQKWFLYFLIFLTSEIYMHVGRLYKLC